MNASALPSRAKAQPLRCGSGSCRCCACFLAPPPFCAVGLAGSCAADEGPVRPRRDAAAAGAPGSEPCCCSCLAAESTGAPLPCSCGTQVPALLRSAGASAQAGCCTPRRYAGSPHRVYLLAAAFRRPARARPRPPADSDPLVGGGRQLSRQLRRAARSPASTCALFAPGGRARPRALIQSTPAGRRRCWSAALSPSLGACSYPRSSGTQPSFSSGHAPCPAPDSGACGFQSAWDGVSGPPRARCASDHGLTASPSRVERGAGPRPPRYNPRCCAAHRARRTGGSWCAARRCVRSSARPTTPAAK